MATEKTVIQIEVDGVQKSINSVKELKAELKAAQSAALNGDGKAAKRVAELKDKMEDLNDSTRSLAGTSIEKGNKAINNLGEGFKNLDFDKVKLGFKGLGSALAATGIMLFVQGITYLIENFDELSKGSGILAKILQSVGAAITWIKDGITDLIGVTDEHSRAIEKQGEAIAANAEKSKESLNATTAAYDRQIAVAKASGKSTIQLEQAKQQAIIDTNLAVAKQIEAFVRAGGELDEEKRKLLSASLESIKNAKVQEYVITETDNKAKQEQYKKHLEEQQKIKDKNAAIDKSFSDKQKAIEKQAQAADDAEQLALQTQRDTLNKQMLDQKHANQIAADNAAVQKFQDDQKLMAEAEKARIDNGFMLTKQGLESAAAISDIFFNLQLSKASANSARELQIRKNQFNAEKAFKIALIVMDGIQGAMKAYALNPLPSPIGVISASLQGIAAAAAAVKVASTQFNPGSQSAPSGGVNISTGGLSGATQAPTLAPPPPQTSTTFTGNSNNQYQGVTKAIVVETDIRHASQRIDTLKEQATW